MSVIPVRPPSTSETSYTARSVRITPQGVRLYIQPQGYFKGRYFRPVPGIDYSQFEVSSFYVGSLAAWSHLGIGSSFEWCPASDLFLPGMADMNPSEPHVPISFAVRGASPVFEITLFGLQMTSAPYL